MSKASKKRFFWFAISIVGLMIAAPNGSIVRHTIIDADPYYFNGLRFGLIALLTTPILFKHRAMFTKKNIWYALNSGFFMALAVISYVWALKLSQASYVSIITLLSPLVFILLSIKLDNGKITRRALAGVSLAALGALTIVALPVALSQNQPFVFYPSATILALVNCITFPLAMLAYKRADDHGISMLASFSLSSWMVCLINIVALAITRPNLASPNAAFLFGIFYSGVMVALISRIIGVRSYEHVGTTVTSVLWYLETLLAILLPVLLLGEKLSTEMIAGGMLILAGIYLVEHRSGTHHKHHLRTHVR